MAAVSDKGGRFKPESFRGSEGEDPEPYMDEFEAISKHNRYTIAERVTVLSICCKDRAKVFIKAYLMELTKTDPTKADYATFTDDDWKAIRKAFIKYFTESDLLLRLQLERCQQAKGESSKTFAERLTVIMDRVNSEMPEIERITHFSNKLLPSIRELVLVFMPKTMRDAIECATRVEIAAEIGRRQRSSTVNTIAVNSGTSSNEDAVAVSVNAVNTTRSTDSTSSKLDQLVEQISKLTAIVSGRQNTNNNTPNSSNNSRQFRGTCNYCGAYGHRMSDCRKRLNAEQQGQSRVNSQNSTPPHTQQQRPPNQQPQQQAQGSPPQSHQTAYQAPMSSPSASSSSADVPTGTSSTTNVAGVHMLTATCNTVNARQPLTVTGFVAGIAVPNMLVDTASGVTAISENLMNRLSASVRSTFRNIGDLSVRSASDDDLTPLGYIIADIQVGGPVGDRSRLTDINFVVLRNLRVECIIGIDTLCTVFAGIDLVRKRLHLVVNDDNYFIPLSIGGMGERQEEVLVDARKTAPIYAVRTRFSIKLKPRETVTVNTGSLSDVNAFRTVYGAVSNSAAVCMLTGQVPARHAPAIDIASAVYPCDLLTRVRCFPVQITNRSDTRICLKAGTNIGTLSMLRDGDSITPYNGKSIGTPIGINHIESSAETHTEPVPAIPEIPRKDPLLDLRFDTNFTTTEQQEQIRTLCYQYADIFATDPKKPSTTTYTRHYIDTGDASPIRVPLYRQAHADDEYVKKELTLLQKNGIIVPSVSPWAFPIVLVDKKDGDKRLCINYQKLNDITKHNAHPIPNVDDLLDALFGAAIYSSLDLASGYWQIRMADEDAEKTAFISKYGLFQWTVMPFGLSTAPATFVKLVDEVLGDLKWRIVIAYFDDIVIYSKTYSEHIEHLRAVFDRLRKFTLQAKVSKCLFGTNQLAFIGFIVTPGGVQPNPDNIAAMKAYTRPSTQTEVRSFLGVCNFYRRFVEHYAEVARPLTQLTAGNGKSTAIQWTDECELAFISLKDKLTAAPILALPDFGEPFILYTDASDYALGAILGQRQDNKERVICYASKILAGAECRYSATEKEAYAIVWAIKRFRPYLLGPRQFTVITDHKPLTALRRIKDLYGRLGRWSLQLAQYNFVVHYREGPLNHVDGLSRIMFDPSIKAHSSPFTVIAAITRSQASKIKESQESRRDESPKPPTSSDVVPPPKPIIRDGRELWEIERILNHETHTRRGKRITHYLIQWVGFPKPTWEDSRRLLADDSIHAYKQKLKAERAARDIKDNDDDSDALSDADEEPEDENSDSRNAETPEVDPTVDNDPNDINIFNIGDRITLSGHGVDLFTIVKRKSLTDFIVRREGDDFNHIQTVTVEDMTPHTEPVDERFIHGGAATDIAATAVITELNNAQRTDPDLQAIINYLSGTKLDTATTQIARVSIISDHLALDANGTLVRLYEPTNARSKLTPITQVIIPAKLRSSILFELHDSAFSAHQGIAKTLSKLRARYWWPRMSLDVANYIASCEVCAKRKGVRAPAFPIGSILPIRNDGVMPGTAWSEVVVDLMGPLPTTANGNRFIAVFVDRLTRYPEAFAIPNKLAATVADIFVNHIVTRYGCPRTLLSDRGTEFNASLSNEIYALFNVHKLKTSAYFPQSNGLVERFNKSLADMLAMLCEKQPTHWDTKIPFALFAYRTAVQSTTQFTPHFMLYGYEAAYPTDIMLRHEQREFKTASEYVNDLVTNLVTTHEIARQNLENYDTKIRPRTNNIEKLPHYEIGEKVLIYHPQAKKGLSNKLRLKWEGPWVVIKQTSLVNYVVRLERTSPNQRQRKMSVHIYRMKRLIDRDNIPSVPASNEASTEPK
jgi:hypothetical protein